MTRFLTVVIFSVFFLLFSCKPKQNVVYLSNNNFEGEVSRARYTGLTIQEGDRLQIQVSALEEIAVRPFNRQTMSSTGNSNSSSATANGPSDYLVGTDGSIVFPVLGPVYCKGMTQQQLKEDIERRLTRYVTDPFVTISLTNFNFFVLGEVNSPGQKTSPTEKLNLFQAIAIAGDLSYDANRTNVKLIRPSTDTDKNEVISLDLSEASVVNSPYYYLQQNDILYIEPDRNKQVAVNNDSATDKWLRYGGIGLGLVTLIITLTR